MRSWTEKALSCKTCREKLILQCSYALTRNQLRCFAVNTQPSKILNGEQFNFIMQYSQYVNESCHVPVIIIQSFL